MQELDGRWLEYVLSTISSRFEDCAVLSTFEIVDGKEGLALKGKYPFNRWKEVLESGYTAIAPIRYEAYTGLILSWRDGNGVVHVERYEPCHIDLSFNDDLNYLFEQIVPLKEGYEYDSVIGAYMYDVDLKLCSYHCIFWLVYRLKYGLDKATNIILSSKNKFAKFLECINTCTDSEVPVMWPKIPVESHKSPRHPRRNPRREPRKSISRYASVHNVSFEQTTMLNNFTKKDARKCTEMISNMNVKFGDLISNTTVKMYRNNGLYIFDGKEAVTLSVGIDGYGNLPDNFRVWEFHPTEGFLIPADYWHGGPNRRIEHNSIVWFDHQPYQDMLVSAVTKGVFDDETFAYTSCVIDGETKVIIYDHQCGDGDCREFKQSYIKEFKAILRNTEFMYFHCRRCLGISDPDTLYLWKDNYIQN